MDGLGRAKQDARAESTNSRRFEATHGAVTEDDIQGRISVARGQEPEATAGATLTLALLCPLGYSLSGRGYSIPDITDIFHAPDSYKYALK